MIDWNIQSRGKSCESCEKSFADKEPYHTLLFDERRDWRRCDVCQSCWDKQYSEARERKGFVSHWQGTFEVPPPPSDAIQKATAESLLRKITELHDERFMAAAFILAVMLERKRLLKIKDQVSRDGKRVFVYEQPGTGDIFTVVDPNLQLNQLEAVQRDVAALLEHGLEAVVAPQEAGAPTPPDSGAGASGEPIAPEGTSSNGDEEKSNA